MSIFHENDAVSLQISCFSFTLGRSLYYLYIYLSIHSLAFRNILFKFNKHYAIKAYGGVGVQIQIFLTSALVGGEWSASRPDRFTPGKRAPSTHWIGGWVGPRAGLDDAENRKFLTLPGLELRPLGRAARSQSLYRLSYPGSRSNAIQ
jgi:hypothetical protein